MLVRLAQPDEHPLVGALTVRVYVEAGYVAASDPYVDYLRDTAGRARDAEVWVAEVDGVIVGSVTRCPHGSAGRELARDDEGEFRTLVVAPEARGRGVGTALVERCLALSREDGDTGMVLSTLPAMRDAHRLYERLGFRRDPAADWSPVPGVDLLAYRLRLRGATGSAPRPPRHG